MHANDGCIDESAHQYMFHILYIPGIVTAKKSAFTDAMLDVFDFSLKLIFRSFLSVLV